MTVKKGRPVKPIDWEQFDKLCSMQCTLREIAAWFDVSEDTIERATKREHNRAFADYYSEKSQRGKIAIRRKQYEVAMNGNVPLLIWLGKQWLGQSDKQEIQQTVTGTTDLKVTHQDLVNLVKATAKKEGL